MQQRTAGPAQLSRGNVAKKRKNISGEFWNDGLFLVAAARKHGWPIAALRNKLCELQDLRLG